jgi:hypothetical protein
MASHNGKAPIAPVDDAAAPSNGHSKTTSSRSNTAVPRVNPPVGKPSRKDVEATFSKFATLIRASNRPLPHRYGDGRKESEDDEVRTGVRADIVALRKDGFLKESLETLVMFANGRRKGGPVDDKTMIVSDPFRWRNGGRFV